MEILYHANFLKAYRKRIKSNKKLDLLFQNKIQLFIKNYSNPTLKDHELIGEKENYRAFWLTGDYRVVYKKVGSTIILYNIGTHNQVY